MKWLWRPVCVWILGHDWRYWYRDNHGMLHDMPARLYHAFDVYFSHQTCHRCGDRIG